MRTSAARRFALALAGHLHGGGGVSERSVGALASHVGVMLVDAAAGPVGERPADPFAEGTPKCHRCGRTLSRPRYVEGFAYGSTCVSRIGVPRARGPYSARNAGEIAP